jgi:tRNA pseudouridine synthase 10
MQESEKILLKTRKILEAPVCDHCLGRQFAQLLSGYTNAERGSMLRTVVAMSIDNEKPSEADKKIDLSNFSSYKFHNLEAKNIKSKKCSVCGDVFEQLDAIANKIVSKIKNHEFSTFLMGTKVSSELSDTEERLWETAGIDYCEPLKAEINRELGKIIERKTGMKFNPKVPDVNIIVKIPSGNFEAVVNPLFIYGQYQKLVRGIPQTKWPSGKYKTSVEQIIARPFMLATQGKGHKLHGAGREDIDARCIAWRPFVLEILEPKKRKIDLKKLAKKIDKKVKVRNMHFSNINEVRAIKEARYEKTYLVIVACEKPFDKKDLKKLTSLITTIKQKTPTRVLHRRADRFRKRKILALKAKPINKKTFSLTVKSEAGLYVKELISSDSGRTQPSVSQLLDQRCVCKQLDVINIHVK